MALGEDIKNGFHEIPVWGWWVIAIGGVIVAYVKLRGSKTSAATTTGSTPIAVPASTDPTQAYYGDLSTAMAQSEQLSAQQFNALQATLNSQQGIIGQLQTDLHNLALQKAIAGPPGPPGPGGPIGPQGPPGPTVTPTQVAPPPLDTGNGRVPTFSNTWNGIPTPYGSGIGMVGPQGNFPNVVHPVQV